MAKVRVVTDSAAELRPEVADALGITVVPMVIRFGDEEFRDGLDMSAAEFYRRVEHSNVMPVGQPPSFRSFQDVYSRLSEITDQVISIHCSSRLNRSYHVATAAAEAFLEDVRLQLWTPHPFLWGKGSWFGQPQRQPAKASHWTA